MRADANNIVSPTARGRDSVRISSQRAYDEAVVVLDLSHMPEGCGTWPAFWSLSQRGPWPHGGEIDIIEGERQVIGIGCADSDRSQLRRRQPRQAEPGVTAHNAGLHDAPAARYDRVSPRP